MEYRIKINDQLLATFFIGGDKGTVVYASGLPQYIQKHHTLISEVIEAGYSICIPRYYGTWESGGDFTVDKSAKAIRETLDFIKIGRCKELFAGQNISWNTNRIILLGYSYGALPILKSDTDDIDSIILVCPFVSSKFQNNGESIETTLNFIEKAYQNVYRFNKSYVLKELINISFKKKKTKLTVIKGLYDKNITEETFNFLKETYNIHIILEEIGHTILFKESYLDF